MTLTFDLESGVQVTYANSVPILVFLGLSVLDLGPMYATDVKQHHPFMPPTIRGGGIITLAILLKYSIQHKTRTRHFNGDFPGKPGLAGRPLGLRTRASGLVVKFYGPDALLVPTIRNTACIYQRRHRRHFHQILTTINEHLFCTYTTL